MVCYICCDHEQHSHSLVSEICGYGRNWYNWIQSTWSSCSRRNFQIFKNHQKAVSVVNNLSKMTISTTTWQCLQYQNQNKTITFAVGSCKCSYIFLSGGAILSPLIFKLFSHSNFCLQGQSYPLIPIPMHMLQCYTYITNNKSAVLNSNYICFIKNYNYLI